MVFLMDSTISFINYWWFRYLMVTELYMVEKWERVIIHIIFAILFGLIWYFNYTVVINLTGTLFGNDVTSSGPIIDPGTISFSHK